MLTEALEVLEGWPELWRHPDLFRQQSQTTRTASAGTNSITEATLRALASPMHAPDVFRAFLSSGDFAAASALLDTESFRHELLRVKQSHRALRADLEAAMTAEKRRQHIAAEGLRMRALRLGKLDSQIELQLQQAVTAVEQSRHSSESMLREIERKLGGPSGSAQPKSSSDLITRWPFKDAAARVCGWFLGEEKAPPDAARFAPSADDADARQLLKLLRSFCAQNGMVDVTEAVSLLAVIERVLGTFDQPAPDVRQTEWAFRSALRGLDSPWLPELGSAALPDGVPFIIPRGDGKLPSPNQLPPSLFLSLALSEGDPAEMPERGLRISPATFFCLLKDKASRRERFLAELGAQIPRTMIQKDVYEVPAAQRSAGEPSALNIRRSAFAQRLAALGIRDLHPAAEVLDRLAFFSGGLAQLESRLIWEIAQKQRIFGRRRQARLDLEGVQTAYESPRFQEYAQAQLLGSLDHSPIERLVLGSLCEALGVDLLSYPVAISDLKVWLQMNDRQVPEESLLKAVRALIEKGLLQPVGATAASVDALRSIRLPPSGVGHLILRELAAPDRVRNYVDSAYKEQST